jgi:hypothetical protein
VNGRSVNGHFIFEGGPVCLLRYLWTGTSGHNAGQPPLAHGAEPKQSIT